MGSSPRVWGQANTLYKLEIIDGIIPTRVGTSIDDSYKAIHEGDHPHACGDKERSSLKTPCCLGSSPRVWGQVFVAAE